MNAATKTHSLPAAIRRSLYRQTGTIAALSALAAPAALADPTGGTVVEGNAEINPQGNGTIIDQLSQRAIIDWETFNIGADEYVLFNQPGSSAVILNRVIGGDPSNILGNLTANGQVFLVNPNGVFFGANASLDVGGLLATTLDISNADFMAGNYHFTDTTANKDLVTGEVSNAGHITANNGGYVILAGDRVENSGVIAARAGHVVLATGRAITLDVAGDGLVNFAVDEATLSDMAGVHNAGSLLADGGLVLMTAKVASELVTTAVNNEGLIQAHGISEQQDGTILLTAEGGDIVNAGTLDASGKNADGGTIIVHSDRDITLADGATQTVAADSKHAAGTIRAIAEEHLDFQSGNIMRATAGLGGGFIEVSGHETIALRGTVQMNNGTYLIDPSNINIVAGTATGSAGTVGVDLITTQLDAGNHVIVAASNSITATGITSIGATGNGALTLGIGSMSAGSGGTCIGLGDSLCFGPNPVFTPGTGGNINLAGIDINIGGDFNAIAQQGEVTLGNVTTTGGAINITGDLGITVGTLDAAGNITLDASGIPPFGIFDNGINVNGGIAAGGSVNITAIGDPSYGGGNVNIDGNINAGGALDILASGDNFGTISIDGSISASSVTLENLNSAGGDVRVRGNAGTGITATAGDINITAANGSADIASSGGEAGEFGQSVTAAGNLIINANGDIVIGEINAGGGVTLDTGSNGNRILVGSVSFASPSDVFTYADITAGGNVQLTANGDSGNSILIAAGNVSGTSVTIQATNNDTSYGGDAIIRTGDITATTGLINLQADAGSSAFSGNAAASIDAGNLTAATTVTVNAFTGGGSGLDGHITTGAISGTDITVHHNGNQADINLGALSANDTSGPALISVVTGDHFSVTQAGNITISGDITASGAVDSNCTDFSCYTPSYQPIAAQVELTAGNGGNTGNVTVNGNIAITANTGNVSVTIPSDATITVNGTGGAGVLDIRGQAIDISGGINMDGADVLADIQAKTVNIGSAITLTATGHDTTIVQDFGAGSISSSNNAGNALFRISGLSSFTPANSVTLGGDVTLNGIGRAIVEIFGADISTRSISVEAAAATFNRTVTGTVFFSPQTIGPFGGDSGNAIQIDEGTITGGFTAIRLFGGFSAGDCGSNCGPIPANNVTVNGDLSANGVGQALINVLANTINVTGAVSATAAAGSVDGTGTFNYFDSATSTSYDVAVTQQGAIGNADVRLSSQTGDITVGGDITVSGVAASLDVDANSGDVNIQGVSVTGAGGDFSETHVYTAISGSGADFSTSTQGSGRRITAGIFGNSVTINGNVDITGAGFAGIWIAGFNSAPVINGDITLTATSATITERDTRISPTAVTNTVGDVGIILGQFNSDDIVIGSADLNGSLTLNADKHAHLLLNADIRDNLIVNAGGRIDTVLPAYAQNPSDPDSLPAVTLAVTAGGLGLNAGNSINFSGGTLDVDTNQDIAIVAGGNVNLGTTNLTTTKLLSIVAGGSISNGVGSFIADGIAVISNTNIDLGGTTFTIGDGTFADIPGDELLLLGLSTQDLEPGSSSPNAYFSAGNSVTIGGLSVAGGYAWFETHDITFNGMVTGPGDLLVQFTPFGGEGDITISNDIVTAGSGKALPPGLLLGLGDFQAIQDGATIAIGTSGYAGNVSIATIDIGARNFLTATSGDVNSLDNITTTGVVKTLSELIALTQFDTPQIEEIDVNYGDGENEVGDKEGEDTDGDGIPDTREEDSMIKHDTTEEGGVCKV